MPNWPMSAALLVADSGPLIALARLQLLHLPARLFREVQVAAIVWEEVTRAPPADEGKALHAALQAHWLTVVASAAVSSITVDAQLDAGERAAIALALQTHAILLIDERRGRASATALGLQVLGTLGLLVLARDAGLIERIRPLTDALTRSGYYFAPALVQRVLAAAGE
jgi:predicted nucleic acid-binding protein